jgi:hypothetical protein
VKTEELNAKLIICLKKNDKFYKIVIKKYIMKFVVKCSLSISRPRPSIWKELLANGVRVGKERGRRLMVHQGIKAYTKRKLKATTKSLHV